jgi:hypothetical protein
MTHQERDMFDHQWEHEELDDDERAAEEDWRHEQEERHGWEQV